MDCFVKFLAVFLKIQDEPALSANGTTIIVTTHFMEEAQYCDRLIIQDAGRTIIAGTPEAVRAGAPSMDAAFIRVVEDFRRKKKEAS